MSPLTATVTTSDGALGVVTVDVTALAIGVLMFLWVGTVLAQIGMSLVLVRLDRDQRALRDALRALVLLPDGSPASGGIPVPGLHGSVRASARDP